MHVVFVCRWSVEKVAVAVVPVREHTEPSESMRCEISMRSRCRVATRARARLSVACKLLSKYSLASKRPVLCVYRL